MGGASKAPARGLSAFMALRYPDYRRLWLAMLVSSTGDWMQITGRAFLVYAVTGSAAALGVVYLFTYAPQFIFALVGGALADRVERKKLVVAGEIAQLSLAVALGVLATTGWATLANIAVLSFAYGVTQTMMAPAGMALLPSLVPREALHGAVSLMGMSHSATRVSGPLLAGVVIPLWGVEWVFYASAASFGFILWAWLRTKVPPVPKAEEPTTWRSIPEGLRHVRRTPTLVVPIVAIAFLSAIGLVYQPLGVVFATDILASGNEPLGGQYFGFMQAAMGLGAVVAMLGLDKPARRWPAMTVIGAAIGFSAALVTLAGMRQIGPALAVIAVMGGLHFANSMLIMTIVQHEAPERLRGRVTSVLMVAWIGIFPFSSFGLGHLAARIGVPTTFLAAGVACLVFSVALIPFRRHIRLSPTPPEDPVLAGAAPQASPEVPVEAVADQWGAPIQEVTDAAER